MCADKLIQRHIIAELIDTIEQVQPESLVYCTGHAVPALDALSKQGCQVAQVQQIGDLEALPRFELGVVFDFLEQHPADEGLQLLCRLRNLKCEKVWAAVTTCENWNFNTMIGLGFKRLHSYVEANQELCTYSYDIASYNRTREWNNSRFWANPENWGKYRW